MKFHTEKIPRGIHLGKENGLSLLLDAEVYDYAFSPQKGLWFMFLIITQILLIKKTFFLYFP